MAQNPHNIKKIPAGKTITMTADQAARFIANDFFNSMVQYYEMIVTVTNGIYEEATSNIIKGYKYFIKHFKNEKKFRIGFTKFYEEQGKEPMFRQVEVTYTDILQDIIFYRLQNGVQFAWRMFDILENVSDEDFNKASEEFNKNTQQKIIL